MKSSSVETLCIDLHAAYPKLKHTWDESRVKGAHTQDPWLMQIPCRHGHIYPHGGTLLAASTNRRGHFPKKFSIVPSARILQDGDDGINVSFEAKDFRKVSAIMKPRRRRVVTPEQAEALNARLQKARTMKGKA